MPAPTWPKRRETYIDTRRRKNSEVTDMEATARNTGGVVVSTDPTYTFTVTGDRTLTAVFEQIPVYTITAAIDPEGSGTVTGAGRYQEGETVTLTAEPAGGYEFTGWQEGGQTVSTSARYSFTAAGDRTLVGVFAVASLLPKGYTQVEYIHTDGNCGIVASPAEMPYTFSKIRTHIRFQLDSGIRSSWFQMMGNYRSTAVNSNYVGGNCIAVRQYNSSYIYASYVGGKSTSGGSAIESYFWVTADPYKTPFEINLSPSEGIFTLSNGSATGSKVPPTGEEPYDSTYPYKTGLFGRRSSRYSGNAWSSSYEYPFAMKLFSIRFSTTSGTDIHDYVPCKDPSGVPGLYDIVGKKFFGSTTGTAFTAGPAV